MRRVIAFFTWQAKHWKVIAQNHADELLTSSATIEVLAIADVTARDRIRQGKVAYAHLQASIRDKMKYHCEKKWYGLCSKLGNMDGTVATSMIECH